MKKYLTVFIFVFILSVSAFAHSGRTDQYGGHYDRSTGEYHYHTGEYAGQKQYNSSINTKNNSAETEETGTKDYRELAGLPKESLIDKIARENGTLEG